MEDTTAANGSATGAGAPPTDILARLNYLCDEVKYNRDKINAIEERLARPDLTRRTYSTPQDHTIGRTEQSVTDDTELIEDFMFLSAKKTIPEVRECTFAQFKNRFDKHGRDGRYAVDALVSGSFLQQEIQEEHNLRSRLFDQQQSPDAQQDSRGHVKDKGHAKAVKNAIIATDLIQQAQLEEKWVRRLRIQSPVLLRILAKIHREKWSDRPRTYYRPFHALIWHHPQVQNALKELEERWGEELDRRLADMENEADAGNHRRLDEKKDRDGGEEEDEDEDEDGEEASSVSSSGNTEEDDDMVVNSPEALACLRAYVAYMEKQIMPDYRRFEDQDFRSGAKIRFSDLWYLFRTGELVYRQVDGELASRRDFRSGKLLWKTYYLAPVPERLAAEATDEAEIRDTNVDSDEPAFQLGCYYIDYTGEEFCVVKHVFKIEQYVGEMLVTSLPVFPMRFYLNWEHRLRTAQNTGNSLIKFIQARHCSYNGWTLTQKPNGEPTIDATGAQLQQPEYINSEVMIDFHEAFQQCPKWRPEPANMRQKIAEGFTLPEDFRIRWWSGADRVTLLGETTELIAVKSGVTFKQRNAFISEDKFLQAVSDNAKRLKPTTEKDLTEEDKALLTGRVFAYVFQERKFCQLSVAKLRPFQKTGLALDSLKIPPTVKHAIQGSVQGHFLEKEAEYNIDQDWASLDLIQGKGTGLFILLHGVPGVGKTATAEAIAQANSKPLFKITVGDLGMTPEKLETALREIFRLASIWDCILLLDEVDTFFSQRSQADTATTKNALVSVFLRVLDYYNGILFLTTNRAGVLDEAFKSRIHYKIYYPDLSKEQTLDIWQLNIDRLRKIENEMSRVKHREPLQINEEELLMFAERLFDEGDGRRGGLTRWNGRQIRNAFQVARSLAYYDHGMRQKQLAQRRATAAAGEDLPSVGPPSLEVEHFETMRKITASFENYRRTIHGSTDAEMALETEVRNDKYKDPLTEGLRAEYKHHREERTLAAEQDGSAALEQATRAAAADVAIAGTFAVTGSMQPLQRPRLPQHHHSFPDPEALSRADDPSPTHLDGFSPSGVHPHRSSMSNRQRSSSYLATQVAAANTSSPTVGYDLAGQMQPRYQLSSPRHIPGREQGPVPGGLDSPSGSGSGSFLMVGQPRPGPYATSAPRNNSLPMGGGGGGPAYRGSQQQFPNEGPMAASMPRGPSPGIGEGGAPLNLFPGAREYQQQQQQHQELYGPGGVSFSPTVAMAAERHGSAGWAQSAGVGGSGLSGQFPGQSRSGPPQESETDLMLDDDPF